MQDECKLCDQCKQPFVVTRTKVTCSTCKACFCSSSCKKNAKKDHKKCISRTQIQTQNVKSEAQPEDSLVIEDDEIRNALFGLNNEFKCGYYDGSNVLQVATTPERAIELISTHYQRLRSSYLVKVPTDADSRSTGVLRVHFDDFFQLAKTYISNEIREDAFWMSLDTEMIEKVKALELGQDYFGLVLTVGPRNGPFVCNKVERFLYNGMSVE